MLRAIPIFFRSLPAAAALVAAFPAIPRAAGDAALDTLIASALARDPALQAGRHEADARRAAPGRRWSLEAPQVGVEFYQAPIRSFPNPLKNQMEIDYTVQQALPFPGKQAARIRAEDGNAGMGEAEWEAARLRAVRDVKAGWYALYLADRRLELNARGRELAARIAALARSRYEVGLGGQSDILRAQAEATRLRMDSIGLAQERLAAVAELNARLDRDGATPIAGPDSLVPRPAAWRPEAVAAAAAEAHPEIRAARAGVRMREAERDLAGRQWLPDFMVGGAYKDMRALPPGVHGGTPDDQWSLMVGLNVPVAPWSAPATRAAKAQGDANLGRARAGHAGTRNAVMARARAAAYAEAGARERLRLAREILLPQARQAWESALSAYQGGKGAFSEALDAWRDELMAHEECETALVAALLAQADLEEAAGMDLDALAAKAGGTAE